MSGTSEDIPAINKKQEGDCGYVCHYGGKRIALYAKGIYPAQLAAAKHFKVKEGKSHMISCLLAENADGSVYVQSTAQFG